MKNYTIIFDEEKMRDDCFSFSKTYIVSLQKNKRLRDYYIKNAIWGGKFAEVLKKEDFKKISDGVIIYFLSSKEVSNEIKEEILNAGSDRNLKIAVSTKKYPRLNSACSTHIKVDQDYKKTHRFLKEIIECINLPSLVGLDYADIKQIFMMSSRIDLREYKAKLSEKDKIIKDIKKEFNKVDSCFFVVSGGVDMTLSDVSELAEKMSSIAGHEMAWSARAETQLNNKIELRLYVGWRE